jgi:hypothetical protein
MSGDVADSEIRCKGRDKKNEPQNSGLVRYRRYYFGNFGTKSVLIRYKIGTNSVQNRY